MKTKIGKIGCLFGVLLGLGGAFWLLFKWTFPGSIVRAHTKEAYFIPVNIRGFTQANIPYLDANIEHRSVVAKIDLGYEGDICLPSSFVGELKEKTFLADKPNYALTGKIYRNAVYQAPKIYIGNAAFFPIKIEEMNSEFEKDVALGGGVQDSPLGRIGWRLFYNFNLLVDCQHSTIAFCDSLATLGEHGYAIDSFTETALLLDRGLIEFEAQTERGPLRCALDTGSTYSMLNKNLENIETDCTALTPWKSEHDSTLNPENKNLMLFDSESHFETSTFSIGGRNIGPMAFHRIKSPIAIDAVIGMDFFESNAVFLDFFNKKLYFLSQKKENGERF